MTLLSFLSEIISRAASFVNESLYKSKKIYYNIFIGINSDGSEVYAIYPINI